MRPRLHASRTPADRQPVPIWARNLITTTVIVAGTLLLHAIVSQPAVSTAQTAGMDDQVLAPACMQWHQAASVAVARLAESTQDSDLRQVNDAIFRMRRARRNCEEGWLSLACQDYYLVARNLASYQRTHEESLFACRRTANGRQGPAAQ